MRLKSVADLWSMEMSLKSQSKILTPKKENLEKSLKIEMMGQDENMIVSSMIDDLNSC
jgi:hypothetical protein